MGAFALANTGPVALSAAGFSVLHVILKKGSCFKTMRRMFQRRKDRGLLAEGASPDKLASQAEARIVNEVHNFAVLPMAIMALFDKRLNDDKFHGASEYGRIMSLISSGYFMVDMTIVLKHFEEHGPEPLIHAVICVTFFMYSAITYHMQWFVPRTLLWEVSTPFVHLRWLLHALGRSKTTFYKVNGLTMMAVFFGARVVFGSKLVWNLWRDGFRYMRHPPNRNDLVSKTSLRIFKGLSSVIQMLNIFWFYKMCRGAVKVFRPGHDGSTGGKRNKKALAGSSNSSKPAASVELSSAAPGELMPSEHEDDGAGAESSTQSSETRAGFATSDSARLDNVPGQEDLEVIDIPEEDV